MKPKKIVLADWDEGYLLSLEQKFIDGWRDEAQIEVITEKAYLESYFAKPRELDLLLISERLYAPEMEKHNIRNIFILTENTEQEDGMERGIYKYTSVDEIYQRVAGCLLSERKVESQDNGGNTGLVLVYSPIGGSGKTTIAAGLCRAFGSLGRRACYVGLDSLQSFGWLMEKPCFLGKELERRVLSGGDLSYEAVKPYIGEGRSGRGQTIKGTFDILAPFSRLLLSVNLGDAQILHLLEDIKKSGDYDFIVIDTSSDFQKSTAMLMNLCDRVVLIVRQDFISASKLECLLKNIDDSDGEKFLLVCNQYEEQGENALLDPSFLPKMRIREYFPREDTKKGGKGNSLLEIPGLHRLAMLLL